MYESDAGLVRVRQAPDGSWQVIGPDGSVLVTCTTNAEAWKAYDKFADQPLSPKEALGSWNVGRRW